MKRKNIPLKVALMQSGRSQYEIAADAGMSETRLSRLACGRSELRPEERQQLARVLGLPEAALAGAGAGDRAA